MDTLIDDSLRGLANFWALVVDVWTQGFLGIALGQIIGGLLILAVFVMLRKLFTRFVITRLRESTLRIRLRFPRDAVDALEGPVSFIPIVIGVFFAFEFMAPDGTLAELGSRVVRSLVVYVIFWGLYNLVNPLSFLLARLEKVFTSAMVEWLVKAIRLAILFIGTATILEIWGVRIGPILAGLGLIGVAVALGAQDLFKNLIGGILILVEKRFSHGDWVNIEGVVEGTVESIGFRSTVVRRFDRAPVFVPNARFADSPVTNFSKMTHRRIFWRIGVLYASSTEQLRRIRDGIEAYILDHPDEFAAPSEVPTFVRIDRFSDSSIDIMVYCFTRTTNWGAWLEIKERLACHIKTVVEEAGSGFAFPSRSLYFETPQGEAPEPFIPPGEDPRPESPTRPEARP